MVDNDKQGLTLSISVMGIIIAITSIIITLLSLFNVFDDTQEETLCPPNQCNISASNCSTLSLSCPNIITDELLNTPSIVSSNVSIKNATFVESSTIPNISNNVKFLDGMKTNLKLDGLNVTFQNVSISAISGTSLTSSKLTISDIIVKNSLTTNQLTTTNFTITSITTTNSTISNLITNKIEANTINVTNFNGNRTNYFVFNNLKVDSIECNNTTITNCSFTGQNLNFSTTSKIINVSDINVSENLNVTSSNIAGNEINAVDLNVSSTQFSYISTTNLTVNNILNCVNISNSLISMTTNKIVSVPTIRTKDYNFTNINLQDSFVVSNTLTIKNLSTTNQTFSNITVGELKVNNNELIENLNVYDLKINRSTIDIYNLTLTTESTTIYIIESENTLKTAINDSNTLLPYYNSYFLTTDLSNKTLKLNIHFKASSTVNDGLILGNSFQLLISTKNFKSNLQISLFNEMVAKSLRFISTNYLYNSFLPSNKYTVYQALAPVINSTQTNISKTSIFYYNNQLLPINDTINFYCYNIDSNDFIGRYYEYSISASN